VEEIKRHGRADMFIFFLGFSPQCTDTELKCIHLFNCVSIMQIAPTSQAYDVHCQLLGGKKRLVDPFFFSDLFTNIQTQSWKRQRLTNIPTSTEAELCTELPATTGLCFLA
jgi:hypothetical protein